LHSWNIEKKNAKHIDWIILEMNFKKWKQWEHGSAVNASIDNGIRTQRRMTGDSHEMTDAYFAIVKEKHVIRMSFSAGQK